MTKKATKKVQENSKKTKSITPFYKTPFSRLPSRTKRLRGFDEKLSKVNITSLTRTHYNKCNLSISVSNYSDILNDLSKDLSGVTRWDLKSKYLLELSQFKSCVCYIAIRKSSGIDEGVLETSAYLSNMLTVYYREVLGKRRIHNKPLEDTCIFLSKHLHRMVSNSKLSLSYYRWKGTYTKAIKESKEQKEDYIYPNYNYLLDLIDMLIYNGMGVSFTGFKFGDGDSENSLFIPSGDLLEQLIEIRKDRPKVKDLLTPKSTIIIRDHEKNVIASDNFHGIEEFIEVNTTILEKLNCKIQEHTIEIDGVVLDGVSFSRIFIDSSVDLGGRLFDRGEWTTLPKFKRKLLTISGESILTADLKAIHPSLLYREEGVILPEDFDPYPDLDISFDNKDCNKYCKYYSIKDYNPKRALAKLALLIMLNSESEMDAKRALRFKMIRDYQKGGTSREDSMQFVGLSPASIDEVISQVKSHNQPIAHHFFTGVSKRLMRVDSDIMTKTAELLLEEDIVMLPLHDSISVPKSKIDIAIDKFKEAYTFVLGDCVNFKVEIE